VGVLLVPDPAVRGGVHALLCAATWRTGQAGSVRGQGCPGGESEISVGARLKNLAGGERRAQGRLAHPFVGRNETWSRLLLLWTCVGPACPTLSITNEVELPETPKDFYFGA